MRGLLSRLALIGLLLAANPTTRAHGEGHSAEVAAPSTAVGATPPAQPVSITLSQAEERGVARSHLMTQSMAREQQALARLRQVAALPNPSLSLSAQTVGSANALFQEAMLLTQPLTFGDKRTQPVAEARAELAAMHADVLKTHAEVVLAVDLAYFEAQRADQESQLARESDHVAEAFLEAARQQFKAGDVARSNVVRVEAEQA